MHSLATITNHAPSSGLGKHLPTDVLKSVLIISLVAITLLCSLLPFALRRAAISTRASVRRRHAYVGVFSFLSCFGGGVFLGTCLLDLFPDTRELIGDGLERLRVKTDFPLAEFFVAIGFFLVLFIEQIVLWFREQRQVVQPNTSQEDRRRLISGDEGATTQRPRILHRRHSLPASRLGALGTIGSAPFAREHRHRHHSRKDSPSGGGVLEGENIAGEGTIQEEEGPESPTAAAAISTSPLSPERAVDGPAEDTDSILSDVHFDPDAHSTFRAIMLVMALSCHASFEGLALGLQLDAATALQIFGALCIHKSVIAFSLGMRLVQSRLSTLSIVGCCLLFCVSALIGGFIGLAITETVKSSSASMINGCLQGIACGTFLYITAFEILPHELNDGEHRLPKLIMLVIGFAFICIFVLVYPS